MEAPHVVIFPYDEHGHATPAFAFAHAVARTGVQATLVLTATRYANVTSKPTDTDLFHVDAIPDRDLDDGMLQDDVCFLHSLRKLEPGLEELMLRMQPRPSCLISDVLYPWSQDLADRLGLPRLHFCVFPAISFLLSFHSPVLCSKGLLPFQPEMRDEVIDFIPGLPKGFRLTDVAVDLLSRDHKHLEVLSRLHRGMKRAAGVVINSVYELEPDVIDALAAEGFSIFAVGPMFDMDSKDNRRRQMPYLIAEDEGCLPWLDNQPLGAVVYVALGSLVSLTEEEIQEVALGLEACGQPFLWVLPQYPRAVGALPTGFQERTKQRGHVIAWAPQTKVLEHASIGCFLSHCGMSSVLEAIWAGVPMIGGFCKTSDQNTVLRLVTKEWGIAMALRDGNALRHHDSQQPLIRYSVETCVKDVIHGEEGLALSQNVLQLKAAIRKAVEPNGSSYLCLRKLVDALHSNSYPTASFRKNPQDLQ